MVLPSPRDIANRDNANSHPQFMSVRLPGPIFLLNLVKSGGNHFFALNDSLGSLDPIPTGSGALGGELNF